MKKRLYLLFGISICVFLLGNVYGIGMSRTEETIVVPEGEIGCISFGIFNSVGEDIDVGISVSGDISQFFTYTNPELLEVRGNTARGSAENIEVCFEIPEDLYNDDKKCLGEMKEYNGFVHIMESNEGGGGGSSTSLDIKDVLSVKARCIPDPFNITLLLIVVALLLVFVIVILGILKLKKNKKKNNAMKNVQYNQRPGVTGGYTYNYKSK